MVEISKEALINFLSSMDCTGTDFLKVVTQGNENYNNLPENLKNQFTAEKYLQLLTLLIQKNNDKNKENKKLSKLNSGVESSSAKTTNGNTYNNLTSKGSENVNCVKKIEVNENCSACGICFEFTDLLIEASDGKAVVSDKAIINNQNIDGVNSAIENCVENAIKLVEVKVNTESNFKEVSERLEKMLGDIQITNLKEDDFKFNTSDPDYKIPWENWCTNSFTKYNSWDRAYDQVAKDFNTNVIAKKELYITQIYTQYSNKILKPFYTFGRDDVSFYYKENLKYEKVLNEIANEVTSLTDGKIVFGDEFRQFSVEPYKNDSISRKIHIEEFLKEAEEYTAIGQGVKKEMLGGKADDYIFGNDFEVHEWEKYLGEGLFGERVKMTYSYSHWDPAAPFEAFIRDIVSAFYYVDVAERIYTRSLESTINVYKDDIKKEIIKKVQLFNDIVCGKIKPEINKVDESSSIFGSSDSIQYTSDGNNKTNHDSESGLKIESQENTLSKALMQSLTFGISGANSQENKMLDSHSDGNIKSINSSFFGLSSAIMSTSNEVINKLNEQNGKK